MSRSPVSKMMSRLAAAALAGFVVSISFVGCDSAPGEGTVNMGGKDGRAKIQPGAPPAPATDAPATPKPGVPAKGRSIKDRPAAQ